MRSNGRSEDWTEDLVPDNVVGLVTAFLLEFDSDSVSFFSEELESSFSEEDLEEPEFSFSLAATAAVEVPEVLLDSESLAVAADADASSRRIRVQDGMREWGTVFTGWISRFRRFLLDVSCRRNRCSSRCLRRPSSADDPGIAAGVPA